MPIKAKVAVLRTRPETVLTDYQRLFELAGGAQALAPGLTTMLKDNISWHFPMPGANTTPWQLEGSIAALCQAGFHDLVCVQNQTVVTNAFKGEDLNGYVPIFKHHQVPALYNFRPQDMTWVNYRPKARMLALDHIYPEGISIPDYFVGKNIVHLPTVKTHMYTTTTGAMKNAFGGLLNKYRHYTHTWIHETLVDLLAIQKEIHPGVFALMDGTTAGNGPGPRLMEPVIKNVILASADQVAIDAVAAKLMGFDPLSIKYIRLAHEQGLGVGDPREIELVGDDVAHENWGFKVGYSTHTFLAWLAWYGPTKAIQKLIFRSPFVIVPTAIGEFEQDYMYWPLKFRAVADTWRRTTTWGALFQRYQAEGHLLPAAAGSCLSETDRLDPMAPQRWSPEDYHQAYWFAAHAHLGQPMPDTDLPYLVHVGLVTAEIIAALRVEGGHDEKLALQCALLHDVLEDTPVTYAAIEAAFGGAVAAGVLALSKDARLEKAQQMPDSLRRIQQQPPEVWMVKLADRICNLREPRPTWTTDRISHYREEARAIYQALHPASPALAARLQTKIDTYPTLARPKAL